MSDSGDSDSDSDNTRRESSVSSGSVVSNLTDEDLVERLHERISRPSQYAANYPLFDAVDNLDYGKVLDLLKVVDIKRKTDGGEFTILHYAAMRNDPDMVRLLLEKGADSIIDERTTRGHTPLDLARFSISEFGKDDEEFEMRADEIIKILNDAYAKKRCSLMKTCTIMGGRKSRRKGKGMRKRTRKGRKLRSRSRSRSKKAKRGT
jgi:hypothetical protein